MSIIPISSETTSRFIGVPTSTSALIFGSARMTRRVIGLNTSDSSTRPPLFETLASRSRATCRCMGFA